MNSSRFLRPIFLTFVASLIANFGPAAWAANWYVDSAATGSHNGTSSANAWTSFAQIAQSSLAGGDVVWVKSGTYNELFTVTKGGTSALARITYIGTGATQPIVRGITASSVNYVAIVNLEITQGSNYNYPGISLSGVTGWLIQDNYIHAIGGGYDAIAIGRAASTYNIIRHNTIDLPYISGANGFGYSINLMSTNGNGQVSGIDHNLVEYNTMSHGDDRYNDYGYWNIFRNNYLGSMLESDLQGQTDPHIDDIQPYTSHILFERNFSNQNDTGNGHPFNINNQPSDAYGSWSQFIFRFNICSKEGSNGEVLDENLSYLYNNTFVDGQDCSSGSPGSSASNKSGYFNIFASDESGFLCVVRNQITERCNNGSSANINYNGFTTGTFIEDHNDSYPGGGTPGTGSLTNVAPGFNNETALDFSLTSASRLIGAGGALTTASGSGSNSTSLVVADANPFCDGWAITPDGGDWIKIGTNAAVQVTAVNYSTNTLTLSSPQSWSSGANVSVVGMSDIGALPYDANGYSLSGTLTNSGTSYTVTVPDSTIVRYVHFYENGIPGAIVPTTPGSNIYAYTSSGGTVTANLYALYASMTPVVAATVSSGGGGAAPVITSPLTASDTAGTAFTYTITASNSPTSFSAAPLPAGLSVSASGVISGTPTAAGTTSVTIGATNASGTGTATLVLAVNPAAPVISSPLTASDTAGTAFTYTITASNSPTSFSASPLPAGLSISTSSGVISGTPTTVGSTNIAIGATNASGTGTATLVVTVNAIPPSDATTAITTVP